MPPVIDNPILNAPFEEPGRHFRFNDDGITDEVANGRRESDRIYQAVVRAQEGEARIKPILRPHKGEELGTTRYVSFGT